MPERITPRQFHEADGVEDWRVLGEGACTYFRTGSFAAGTRLVHAISQLAGLEDHHPDVDLRYEGVTVRLITITHDYYGLSDRDVEVARQISAVARELGVPADPSAVQTVQVSIDALVHPDVIPFWRAVLGYDYAASPPAATWSATSTPPSGGPWPTPRATRPTWPQRWAATERIFPCNGQSQSGASTDLVARALARPKTRR